MKLFSTFSIVLLAVVFLFSGCFGSSDENDVVGPGEGNGGNGELAFGTIPPTGSWSEYDSPGTGSRSRMESIGEDTFEGHECYIIEYESTTNGEKTIMQIWFEKGTFDPFVAFMKQGNMVIRMDMGGLGDTIEAAMPQEQTDQVQTGTGEYTTPTGKTVKTIKFQMKDSMGHTVDSQMSAEVPFFQVETKSDGVVIQSLYNFGDQGAVRDISLDEAKNAQSFGVPDIPNIPQ